MDFYQSYSPVTHVHSFRINIDIADMHILTARILDVSNSFQNTKVPIHKRVRFGPPPYYLDLFEIYHPNVTINQDYSRFPPQLMNGIQGTKLARRQWNRLLDAVVTIQKYKKTIDYATYIKVFSEGNVYYLTVSTYDVLRNTTNKTEFTELRSVVKEYFDIKVK